MAIEYNFTLDMDRSKRDNNIAYARTGDVDSITINADLVLNGAAYTPTGTNAFFECITPNGHSIRAAAEKTGSTVSVEVPSAAFQAAGVINVAYFRFETGDSSNPTYVESTEPFAIVVREGIGDDIDAGDYIEEWRGLADKLEAAVAEVEKKAEQAETAINEQKTEVDQLKAQAQKAIAGDVTEVEEAAQSAISAINKEKADVANAAEGITEAGEQAINTFKTNSQQAINQFNTNGTSAINQFNTNADAKLEEVDGMITEAQGDVDAAITQLEDKTQDAIDAAQDALDGTTATNLQNAINRTLKLDIADMVNIQDNSSLSSFTNVGSYCCKTATTAATIGDCPVDDSPFNMYVFSSATSGRVMQLVVPIDLNGKPTAEWHVRFGTSSAMDTWSVIGGGADIAAGLGIDVTGDAKKTVSLDTDAFYQHHEAASIIQGSTEVTGGGRLKELTAYGNTRQNLWVNPVGSVGGATVTSNDDGSVTLSGTPTTDMYFAYGSKKSYTLKPGGTYTLSIDKALPTGCVVYVTTMKDEVPVANGSFYITQASGAKQSTGTLPNDFDYVAYQFYFVANQALSGTYRIMLNEGSEAQPWCPPGLNSVDELSIVTAGKNLANAENVVALNAVTVSNADNSDGSFDVTVTVDGVYYAFARENVTINPGTYVFNASVSGDTGTVQVILNNELLANAGQSFTVDNVTTVELRYLQNVSVQGTVHVSGWQLEIGSTPTAYEPPSITTTPIDLQGHTLNALPDGTRDELRIDGTGAVTLVQRVGVATLPSAASGWTEERNEQAKQSRFSAAISPDARPSYSEGMVLSDVLPYRLASEPDYYGGTHIIAAGDKAIATIGTGDTSQFIASVCGGKTLLYALAKPAEVDLPGIAMPCLASPDYTIFTSSNVPTEIEAEVVKVDYLPPSDVYTKEEVDKKIEDAGMPDVVPVSQGGTGVTTAAAERNRLGLGNTTGALPIANGGTGATTAKAAQYNLLNSIATEDGSPEDSSLFTLAYLSPTSANGALYKRTGSNVWNWIVSKIRSTFGFNSSNVLTVAKGGTGSTSARAAQNSLLNDMNSSSDALTDSSMLVGYNVSPSASNGAVHKRTASTVWDYVAGKIRSTFGFSSGNVLPVSHGGTGLTENPSILVNLGSESTSDVLASSPRPGVTGTLPVSHGGTGATAPGVDMLSNLGITFGTADPPSTGTPGSIYIQYFE